MSPVPLLKDRFSKEIQDLRGNENSILKTELSTKNNERSAIPPKLDKKQNEYGEKSVQMNKLIQEESNNTSKTINVTSKPKTTATSYWHDTATDLKIYNIYTEKIPVYHSTQSTANPLLDYLRSNRDHYIFWKTTSPTYRTYWDDELHNVIPTTSSSIQDSKNNRQSRYKIKPNLSLQASHATIFSSSETPPTKTYDTKTKTDLYNKPTTEASETYHEISELLQADAVAHSTTTTVSTNTKSYDSENSSLTHIKDTNADSKASNKGIFDLILEDLASSEEDAKVYRKFDQYKDAQLENSLTNTSPSFEHTPNLKKETEILDPSAVQQTLEEDLHAIERQYQSNNDDKHSPEDILDLVVGDMDPDTRQDSNRGHRFLNISDEKTEEENSSIKSSSSTSNEDIEPYTSSMESSSSEYYESTKNQEPILNNREELRKYIAPFLSHGTIPKETSDIFDVNPETTKGTRSTSTKITTTPANQLPYNTEHYNISNDLTTTSGGQFTCSNGETIPSHQRCDGIKQCKFCCDEALCDTRQGNFAYLNMISANLFLLIIQNVFNDRI